MKLVWCHLLYKVIAGISQSYHPRRTPLLNPSLMQHSHSLSSSPSFSPVIGLNGKMVPQLHHHMSHIVIFTPCEVSKFHKITISPPSSQLLKLPDNLLNVRSQRRRWRATSHCKVKKLEQPFFDVGILILTLVKNIGADCFRDFMLLEEQVLQRGREVKTHRFLPS